MIKKDDLVIFSNLQNARGYPLTGVVLSTSGEYADVKAFGKYGPGTETKILTVPLWQIRPAPLEKPV